MAPYFCHIHNGLYVSEENVEGCQHASCIKLRASNPPKHISFAGGPTTRAKAVASKKFHDDMYAFEGAVKQGLSPEQVSVEASNDALRIAEAEADAR